MEASSLLQKTIQKIHGAYAPATIRAYKSNFENFINFCVDKDCCPLPASPQSVADFILSISEKRLKSASIRLAVAAIATIHKLNSLPDPTGSPDVKLEMRRMHRKLGRHSGQAHGLNATELQKILAQLDSESIRDIRDRAIILLAYDSLCRRSEIVSLQMSDVVISASEDHSRSVRVRLRRSKTDPEASGRWLYLSKTTQECLMRWIDVTDLQEGYLFRGIAKNGKLSSGLTPGQINRIYKKLANRANFPDALIKHISGHSLRVGAEQDLLIKGASLPMIMNRGRWSKSDTVMRYVEAAGHLL